MYIVAVTIFVKPEHVQAFIEATLDNARNTRKEAGNIRFDVIQGEDDPTKFMLYEAYQSKDDFVSHQQQPHYFRWRDAVKHFFAQPRVGAKFNAIFFGDGPS